AQRSLQGHFSDHVNRLMSELVELRAYIEAGIDFPDEEIDLLSEGDVHARIERVREKLNETVRAASQGRMLREGIQVVLAGRPNVGKSSLLNAMVGQERAIVTNIPGTTRDTVEQDVVMSGMQVTLTDTAGLRDADDRVEAQGVARARAALDDADIALFVRDAGDAADASIAAQDDALLATLPIGVPVLVVWNKADLLSASENDSPQGTHDILVSAKTGRGIEDLRGAIVESVGYDPAQEGLFMARRRHLGALEQASSYVQRAVDLIAARLGLELIAEELRLSTIALGEITGEFTTEALLDQIFSRFCIGK
nr:50S ribosome-binding GTPase [Gammaproteobacteria bacterium]